MNSLLIKNSTRTQVDEKVLLYFFEFLKNKLKINKNYWVAVYLVGEKKITFLKDKFFGIRQKTDVIAFPLLGNFVENEEEKNLLGEIFICLRVAQKQAKLNNNSFLEELLFLFAHGILHLLGFDDRNSKDQEKMLELQKKLVNSFLEKNKI